MTERPSLTPAQDALPETFAKLRESFQRQVKEGADANMGEIVTLLTEGSARAMAFAIDAGMKPSEVGEAMESAVANVVASVARSLFKTEKRDAMLAVFWISVMLETKEALSTDDYVVHTEVARAPGGSA